MKKSDFVGSFELISALRCEKRRRKGEKSKIFARVSKFRWNIIQFTEF